MKNLRKTLALLLALCMLTGMLGTTAFAEGEGEGNTDETVVCANLEGCTDETHAEGCPLYVAPETTDEVEDEPAEEPEVCETCGKPLTECEGHEEQPEDEPAEEPEVCEHQWNDGEVTTAPGCETEGVKTFTCTVDGCGETKTEAIEATGHQWNDGETVEGGTQYTCALCGESHFLADEDNSFDTNLLEENGDGGNGEVTSLSGEGTEASPLLISNLDELIWFQKKVDEQAQDGSSQFTGKYVKLTSDIDLAGIAWEPIGSYSGDHGSFKGVFDGDNHTISNLNVSKAEKGLGFFAYIGGNAEAQNPPEIKNVTFHNVSVKGTDSYVGGVVGNAFVAKVTNVRVTGTIDIEGYGYVGGIVGHGYVKVDNCSVEASGTIKSNFWCAGGIVGYGGEGFTAVTNTVVDGGTDGLSITSAAGAVAGIIGRAEDNEGTQPCSGSALSVGNVNISTFTGMFGDGYADNGVAYFFGGGGSTEKLTNAEAENVTATTSTGAEPTISDVVASVGGKQYSTLQGAIAAAGDGDTVKLLTDVDLTDLPGGYNVFDISGMVLDLNEKTITSENKSSFVVFQGKNAKITNGTFAVTDGNYSLMIGDEGETDNLVVENVTAAGVNIYNATNVTLREVTSTGKAYYSVWCDENGHVTIESGNYSSASTSANTLFGVSASEGSMEITGGTFTLAEGQNFALDEEYNPPAVSGGTFNTNVSDYCAPGLVATEGTDGKYTIGIDTTKDLVAQVVGGGAYETLAEAITACPAGGTVKVLADVPLTGSINPGKSITIEGVTKEDGSKPVISGDKGLFSVTKDSATLKNLNLQATGNTYYIYQEADLTVDGCDFTTAEGVNDVGNLIMDDGHGKVTFTNNKVLAHSRVALAGPGNDSVITNNVFDLVNEAYGSSRTSVIGLSATADSGPIIITGNVFKNANRVLGVDNSCANVAEMLTFKDNAFIDCRWALELNPNEQGGFDLAENYYSFNGTVGEAKVEDATKSGSHTDGTSTAYVPTEGETPKVVVSSYYKQYDETNGLSELTSGSGAVAQVGENYYATLQAAIDAIETTGTVTLLKDTTESITVAAGKDITLELNGKTLTNDPDAKNALNYADTIYVQMGGKLTVSGEGTVRNTTEQAQAVFNEGTVTLNGGTYERTDNKGYVIVNHGAKMTIGAGVTVTTTDNGSALVVNGYQNLTTTPNETMNWRRTMYQVKEPVNAEHPVMEITGGTFTGGKHTVSNDHYGVMTVSGNPMVTASTTADGNGNTTVNAFRNEPTATAEIKGGTFNGNVLDNDAANKALQISGGTFSTNVNTYCVNGYQATQNGNDTWGVAAIPATPTTPGGSTGTGGGSSSGGGSYWGGGSSSGGESSYRPSQPEEDLNDPEVPLAEPLPFADVAESSWYYEAVRFVYDKGMMVGTGEGNFSPSVTTSRAMIASILWRLKGEPEAKAAQPFSDVADGRWYTKAVAWAAEEGVFKGYEGGKFSPNGAITREQLAAILWRYAGQPAASELTLSFADADKISSYAQDAMRWAVDQKIITGKGGNILDPGGKTTRAEAAQMLMKFCELQEQNAG